MGQPRPRSADLARIDVEVYIRSLGGYLIDAYGLRGITLKIDSADVALPIDTAIPCRLLVNELISNALKHAFSRGSARRGLRHAECG